MQAVEVPQIVPQGNETAEKPQAPVKEQAVKEESLNIIRQIRNISAFCDCV